MNRSEFENLMDASTRPSRHNMILRPEKKLAWDFAGMSFKLKNATTSDPFKFFSHV